MNILNHVYIQFEYLMFLIFEFEMYEKMMDEF